MKKCPQCDKEHHDSHPHFQIKSQLTDSGFPTHSSRYKQAHRKANEAEEKKYGKKNFKELEKIDNKIGAHRLAGKNLESGKIEVSKKVPEKFRKEVAYHEKIESKNLKKKR